MTDPKGPAGPRRSGNASNGDRAERADTAAEPGAAGRIAALLGPRRERGVIALAVLAVVAMAVTVILGGPVTRDASVEYSPEVAALLEAEDLTRPAVGSHGQTWAEVRLPDGPRPLASYFATMNYTVDQVREGGPEVPRVFVTSLPEGLNDFAPVEAKKALFVRLMLPLVLKANEQVLAERERIQTLRAQLGDLDAEDSAWLMDMAAKYRLEATAPADIDFEKLLLRADVVPPSLAITQSILESGWGTSRFARKGNALFGQRTWSADTPGLAPKEAEGFKVRAFDSLLESVQAYVRNLNTTGAYAALRQQRATMRAQGRRIDGHQLAGTLTRYSEEGQTYVRKLRGLMQHNALSAFDEARLRRQTIAQRVIPDAQVDSIQVALAGN
jgi:Bax protein